MVISKTHSLLSLFSVTYSYQASHSRAAVIWKVRISNPQDLTLCPMDTAALQLLGDENAEKPFTLCFALSGSDVQRKPECINVAGICSCSLNDFKRQKIFKEGWRKDLQYKVRISLRLLLPLHLPIPPTPPLPSLCSGHSLPSHTRWQESDKNKTCSEGRRQI